MTRHPLIGRDVLVTWRDPDSDWRHYTVIDYCDGWMLLRGRDSDDAPYEGPDIFVPMSSIEIIEVDEAQEAQG